MTCFKVRQIKTSAISRTCPRSATDKQQSQNLDPTLSPGSLPCPGPRSTLGVERKSIYFPSYTLTLCSGYRAAVYSIYTNLPPNHQHPNVAKGFASEHTAKYMRDHTYVLSLRIHE